MKKCRSYYLTDEEHEALRKYLKELRFRESANELGYVKVQDKVMNTVPDSRKSQILYLLYMYDYGIRNDLKYSYEGVDSEAINSWISKDEHYGQGNCFDKLYEECRKYFGDFEFDSNCMIKWYNEGRNNGVEEEQEVEVKRPKKKFNPFSKKR